MFVPKPYILKDEQKIYQFIQDYSFAAVVSVQEGVPAATHLPLRLSENRQYLYGHFARANPQWQAGNGHQVLAIFSGPHSYISSAWYETKDAVPTWNYVAVHVNGFIELLEDEEEIRQALHDLVQKYEPPASTYDVNAVNAAYMKRLLTGIMPFKIRITSIEAAAKLSQGHSKERQALVIEALLNRNAVFDKEIAQLMLENNEKG